MKKVILFILFLYACSWEVAGQTIRGTVVSVDGEVLIGATVTEKGTQNFGITDENGAFRIQVDTLPTALDVSYVGYQPVRIEVLPGEDSLLIEISGITTLKEVEVKDRNRGTSFSTLQTMNIEQVHRSELQKAACCNLSESFETNTAVDVNVSNAVLGNKEIQMLGLSGIYTQLLIENRPSLQGLATAFGMEFIPGTWLESIGISKGASSVFNGFQSVSGQINTEIVKPYKEPPLFVNLFTATNNRYEANLQLNHRFNEQWSSGLLLHGNQTQNSWDHNHDGFLDMPNKKQFSGMYRLFHRGALWNYQFNVLGVADRYDGGQLKVHETHPDIPFLTRIENRRLEVFGKVGYIGFEKPYQSIGFQVSTTLHELDASLGRRAYDGTQRNAYANLIYATIIGTTDHKINVAGSFNYDKYTESFESIPYQREEVVPGVWMDYQFCRDALEKGLDPKHVGFFERIGIYAGMRLDHHNLFGWLYTPRVNIKYNLAADHVLRISAGKAYRSANVIAENLGALVSSRQLEFLENPDIEQAWNAGINWTKKFYIAGKSGDIVLDLYHTGFVNQVIVDFEKESNLIQVYNLDGRSFSNVALFTFTYSVLPMLDVKVGYKYTDVRLDFKTGFERRPLVPEHKGLVTLDFHSRDKKWLANLTTQFTGPARFPDNSGTPAALRVNHTGRADGFMLMNAQVTRKWKNLDVYVGIENLTDLVQQNPIIDPLNPFGPYFDANQVIGPLMGIRGHAGIRLTVN